MSNTVANEIELINFKIEMQKQAATNYAQKTEKNAGFAKSGFFVGIFGFFTTIGGKALLMVRHLTKHAALQVFLFPIAGVLEIIDAAAAGIKLGTADNKNLDKTMNFVSKIIPAIIIVTAITLGVTASVMNLAALGAVVPYLFVAALSMNAAYHLGHAVYHAIKMCKAKRESALRAAHKNELISNTIKTVIDTLIVGVIVGLFVFAVSTPLSLGIVAGIGIATLFAGVVISIFMHHYAKKQAKEIENRAHEQKKATTEKKQSSLPDNIANLEGKANFDAIKEATQASGDPDDRLYMRNLARLLDTANTEGKLLEIFTKIIEAKIFDLGDKIDKADETAQKRSRFSNMFTLSEKKKRQAKQGGLTELNAIIHTLKNKQKPISADEIKSMINSIINSKKRAGLFQSYWHDKSDVKLIFDAAIKYLPDYTTNDANSERGSNTISTIFCGTPTKLNDGPSSTNSDSNDESSSTNSEEGNNVLPVNRH